MEHDRLIDLSNINVSLNSNFSHTARTTSLRRSTLVSVKLLDIFTENSGLLPAIFVATKKEGVLRSSLAISSPVCGSKTGCFNQTLGHLQPY